MAAEQLQGTAPRSIALVDLSYMFKRAWHGQARDAAPGAAAQATLDQLAAVRESVEHVIICCDSPPYRRKAIDPQYKAQREKPADEELSQKKWLMDRIERDGYQIARAKGYEADDVIATLCVAYDQLCDDIRIVASDKDMAQLVRDHVRMYVPGVGERPAEVRGPREIREKFGVDPHDMGLWLALVGDSSDNIPGVPGIGPKKATELIANCVNITGIAEALADSSGDPKRGKMWDALAAHWEQLQKSIQLTRLEYDAPVDAAALLERREAQKLVEDDMGDMADAMVDEAIGRLPSVGSTGGRAVSDAEFDPISKAPEGYVAPPVSAAVKAPSEPPKAPTTALAKTSDVTEDLQPTTIESAYRLAKAFHNGRMYQKYPSPEAIFTVLVKARELGLKATTALDCFSVIKGVPRASADLMQALAERDPDCEYFKLIESTPERAVYRVKRKSHKEPFPDFVYTMADAQTADLARQDNYRKNPAAMMRARCKSSAARTAFPGACCGLYCPEEMGDAA
jgi:5'-3' exonuclease